MTSDKPTMEDYRTLCCNAQPYRQSRALYLCGKCSKDVTLEAVLWYEACVQEQSYEHTGRKSN